MRLLRYPEELAVVRLGPGTDLPAWAESSSVFSITATATETSVVCGSRTVPTKSVHRKPFAAFRIDPEAGTPRAGVLVEVLAPLAEDGLDVHTLSTFDAEWVLVPAADAERAEDAWRRAGHEPLPAAPVDPNRQDEDPAP